VMHFCQVEAQLGLVARAEAELQQLADDKRQLAARAAAVSVREEEQRSRAIRAAEEGSGGGCRGARWVDEVWRGSCWQQVVHQLTRTDRANIAAMDKQQAMWDLLDKQSSATFAQHDDL